jgi:MFS family permease
MLSDALARLLRRRNTHYGWAVAAATFLTMLVTAGAVGAPGVFMVPLEQEFGWSASDVSSALALRFVLFGLVAPFAAAFINRFGVRRVVLAALTIVTTGLLSSLAMTKLWQLVLLWGVAVGLGTGLTAMVLGATVATRWFSKRRGLVLGMLSASSATGQLIFLPLLARMTAQSGWRTALGFVCGMLVVATLLALTVLRDRPSDVGLPAYGDSEIVPPPTVSAGLRTLLTAPLMVLREAAQTRVFWILFGTFFICGASTNGLIQTHFIAFCGDHGMVPVAAAGVLATMGVFDFFGTVGSGWLSDRYDNRWLLFGYYGLRGLALLFLPFANFTLFGLAPFAVFYGLDWIATIPPTVRLTSDTFGREKANIVFGWIFAGHQIGAASAALGAGLTRTWSGSYLPAYITAGALCVVAAGAVLTVGRPRRPVAVRASVAAAAA